MRCDAIQLLETCWRDGEIDDNSSVLLDETAKCNIDVDVLAKYMIHRKKKNLFVWLKC